MEGFFYIGCQIDEVTLTDLMLRRYHTLELPGMPIIKFCKLIEKALDEEKKENYRRQWLSLLPVLAMRGKYMSFEQFYEKMSGANIDMRSTDEIIAEIDKAHEEMKNGT